MFSIPRTCGHCNQPVDFQFNSVLEFRARTPEELQELFGGKEQSWLRNRSQLTPQEKDTVRGAAHSQCPRCAHPAMIIYETIAKVHQAIEKVAKDGDGSLAATQERMKVIAVYPEYKEPAQNPDWPDSLRSKFADVQKMVHQNMDPAFGLTSCGSILELALKELDQLERKQSLFDRIDNLHSNGIITAPMKDWAHAIRLDRNDAVHDGNGIQSDAEEYVEFLKLFLDMAFALPKRIERKRARPSKDV